MILLNQLPPTPKTLWLRLLGKGATQQQAIQEVLALPKTDRTHCRKTGKVKWKQLPRLGLESTQIWP